MPVSAKTKIMDFGEIDVPGRGVGPCKSSLRHDTAAWVTRSISPGTRAAIHSPLPLFRWVS
ncbi:MAG: hypothetical protein RXR52_35865, partial [Paraburkholderia sp.]